MRHARLAIPACIFALTFGLLSGTAFAESSPAPAQDVSVAATETDPATVTPTPVTRLEDDDLRLAFRGSWRSYWDTRASGNSRRLTVKGGSYILARFSGTGAALIASRRPDAGRARIAVDGVTVATVSLYSRSFKSTAVWSISGLPNGNHSVTVTALGSKEASSAGVVVSIDAFDFEGKPYTAAGQQGRLVQSTDKLLYRKGRWYGRSAVMALGGSSLYSKARDAATTVHFKGTSISWIGRRSPAHGKAEVLLDGRRVAIIGGAPSPSRERSVLWSATGLRNVKHTLTVRNLGIPTNSAVSTATVVDADAFYVGGTVLFAPRPTPFKYPWKTYIVIDKSQFRLYWVKNKTLIKYYPVAHGKIGWTTPSRLWRIDAKYHTSPTSVYGPRKMRMFKQVGSSYVFSNYAIHGTNEEWVIGTRASHGCIRMYNRDVLELFPQVPLGTMVVTRD